MDRLSFRDKLKIRREFVAHVREIRRENPQMTLEDAAAEATARMEAIYGASPDWKSIVELIMEVLLKLLPFFI